MIRKSPQAARLPSREHAGGLIFGLIHPRSPTFIGIQINLATQVVNVNDIRRTVIPTPENRKVGGSTPPLATTLTSANARLCAVCWPCISTSCSNGCSNLIRLGRTYLIFVAMAGC